jgi:hypothetical protein
MKSRGLFWLLIGSLAELANAGVSVPGTPCEALAAHVKSAAADLGILQRPPGQDYDDYDALFAPIIRFPQPKLADPELGARAERFLGGEFTDQAHEIQHVAGPVWRAFAVAGTAECQTERFFSVQPNGALRAVTAPAVFGDLCGSSSRRIGRVSGTPALVEIEIQTHPLLGVDVELTPWTRGARAACRVAIRFNDAFLPTEKFCKDPSMCVAGEPLAAKLAESLARNDDGATLAAVAPPPPLPAEAMAGRLAKAKARFESLEFSYTELPTFGAKAKTKYPVYGGSPKVTQIVSAGQTLIARVGIGGVGWRELGDYLITLYGGEGDDFAPVASFVVQRKNIGLQSVTTSVPTAYVNTP